jgi:hypothetical protein
MRQWYSMTCPQRGRLLLNPDKSGFGILQPRVKIASDSGRMTGKSESAGINRHVVGDERALGKEKANPSWPRVLQVISRGIA